MPFLGLDVRCFLRWPLFLGQLTGFEVQILKEKVSAGRQ